MKRQYTTDFPRIFIAGLRGGAGKTILSIGIIAALRKLGKSIAPYKKGPDYIDAGWLALAAGRPCYNLDTFLVNEADVLHSFFSNSQEIDIAVIEGNRGLYDGIDVEGTTSSAEVAKLLGSPIILCIDCTKTTRTMAAVVAGCQHFDEAVPLKGIILNRVAGSRHEENLRKNIEHFCDIPVVGAVPKLTAQNFPERHMGLVPTPEHSWAYPSIDAAAEVAFKYVDLKTIQRIANRPLPPCIETSAPEAEAVTEIYSVPDKQPRPRVGIIKDAAFQFYYPDNIEALVFAGAEPVFLSAFQKAPFPEVDALYIGGGFPETHAETLSQNTLFMEGLKAKAEDGLPVYAECGGLMYLGEAIELDGKRHPMSGVLPIVFGLSKRPQGLGYTVVSVKGENPFYPVGTELRGHEFRYSQVLEWRGREAQLVFDMKRGNGFINGRDGIVHKNVLATYTHIHALGVPDWAKALVEKARKYRQSQQ